MRHRVLRVIAFAVFAVSAPRGSAAAEQAPLPYSVTPFAHLFVPAPPSVPPLAPGATPAPYSPLVIQDPAPRPPEPEHTGFGALVRTTGSDFKAFPRRRSTWVILGVGAGMAALSYPIDDKVNDHIRGSQNIKTFFKPGSVIGNGWLQAGAAVATYGTGRVMRHMTGKQNKIAHVGFDLVRADILSQSLTYAIKLSVRRDRPTGECCSFPSGHSSATFAAASVLERHFGYRSAWPTFVIAGYVAASRLHDNRHFLSDVLFGSAIGMASGWTVVGRHGRDQYALLPVKTPRGAMIALTRVSASSAHN